MIRLNTQEGPREVAGVNLDFLGAWMDDEGLLPGIITDVELLSGGTQNILLHFFRGGEEYVLRRPPLQKRAKSDETIRREARVLTALRSTDVPHPHVIAACYDESVLGAAFYLMPFVRGLNPTVSLPDAYSAREWQQQLGLSLADGASAIGAVDYVSVGLEGMGNPEGFLERQVGRWRAQLDSYGEIAEYPGPAIPGLGEVAEWLDANRPTSFSPGLMHGDYHFANVLVAEDKPQVVAIVDWELATIGDPLLDLGWLLATWPDGDIPGVAAVNLQYSDYVPTPADLVARYAIHSSRDLTALPWYEILACYKLGIILEGTYARSLGGKADRSTGDLLHATTLGLFQRALRRTAIS